ncbi:MAG: hypothetical protein ACXWB9_01085 [Flavisolibacter sp.]
MKWVILIWLLVSGFISQPQEPPVQLQQQLEQLADDADAEIIEDDQNLQLLDHLSRHPLNINKTGPDELRQTGLLTGLQIDHFIRYRALLGNFIDLHELQAIPFWNLNTIKKLLPYLVVREEVMDPDQLFSRLKGEHQFLFRNTRGLQKTKGYDTTIQNHYLGNRNHLMARYRYQYKNLLYFGWTGDKDAGEQFFKGAQKFGFDFNSFHLFINQLGIFRSIAVGDYRVSLGQGLIQWQSMGFGKGAEVLMIKRQAPVLQPYRSAGEFFFNRGAAVTIQKGNWEATVFYSSRRVDGNLSNDTTSYVSSMLTSGYHRNEPEIQDRNSIKFRSMGGKLQYTRKAFQLGLNTVYHRLGTSMEKKDEAYQLYKFTNNVLWNSSCDYSFTYRNFHVFGEAAVDPNLNVAFLNGLLMSADAKVDLSVIFRHLPAPFQSLNGNAFTESTQPINESGLYMGLSIRPGNSWQLNAYADFFRFPWLRYRVHSPSSGREYLVQLQYHPGKLFQAHLRYRYEAKHQNQGGDAGIYPVRLKSRQQLRFHFDAQLTKQIHLRSRVEVNWFDKGGESQEEGFMAYMESGFNQRNWGGNIRLQYFQTGGYNSRIYVFESNVLYNNMIPALFNSGFRYYFNLNYKVSKNIRCWFRWSQTLFDTPVEQGSGLDLFKGKTKSDFSFQLMWLL